MLDLLRKHDRLMNKITIDDEDRDDWERLAKLVEEKFTSDNKPSAEIAAAALLCEVYFNIAAECIGEDEVRRRVAATTSHVG